MWAGLSVVWWAGLLVGVSGFNVNTKNPVIQERPGQSCEEDCMFGFSVAQHTEGGTPWVLVGAPRAESGQPGVHKGGAVYKCPALQNGGCQIIPFDNGGDTLTPQGKPYDIKSGQWFGAVVRSSGADGTVLACAHRYIYYVFMFRLDPVGACFVARNNFTKFQQYRPCVETGKWGYHRQGSCQAGLGAAVSKNGEQIYIGAVGSWYWQGQVYSISTDQARNSSGNAAPPGQVFSTNLKMLRNQRKTEEGDPQDDDSYLGYSVTTGEFNGDGDYMDVAVGMPRGSNLTGKVVLYDSNLTNLNNLTGTQIGAYFGYCLATADLNGDGLDDIVIGAPMWTDYADMGKFETGRVYVVYQNKYHRFRDYDTLEGETHKARFGMAVASLGDINLDRSVNGETSSGYHDIAIGAPYDGPEQRGAVYIYLGSAEGVMKKPSQVIYARDLSPNLKTFGWSLSGGIDMDKNQYPDLLVGAYESGHAVHMRAAPVVHMTAQITFDRESKQIDLDDTACTLKDRKTRVPCVGVTVNLQYTGVGVPNKLEYELEYVLDSKKEKQKRMYFMDEEGSSSRTKKIEMLKERGFKDKFKVYLPGNNIKDKLTSLEVQVRYSLSESAAAASLDLEPVLGLGDHLAADSINIQKECGPDNICIPDLSVKTREISSYLMGSGEKLELHTDIINRGEDAFNALLEVQIPRGVSYVNAHTGESGVGILCSPPSSRNNNTLQCEVGNPLRAGAQVSTTVILQPLTEGLDDPISEFEFSIFARSSNPEKGSDDRDNVATFSVPIRVETDFRVTGLSDPGQVMYNTSAPRTDRYEFEDDVGEMVTHVYDVKNKGPSSINEAEVYILWPSFNDYGDHLLYLLGFEYDTARAKCESFKNLNPLSLKTIGSQGYYSSAQGGGAAGGAAGGGYSRESSESTYTQETVENRFGGNRAVMEDDEGDDEFIPVGPLNNQYESSFRTGVQSNTQTRENTLVVRPPVVADGAEETRLFDTQGKSFEETKSLESSRSSYSGTGSSFGGAVSGYQANSLEAGDTKSSGEELVHSGWRMLPNGTYIRVYDRSSTLNKKSRLESGLDTEESVYNGNQNMASSIESSSSYLGGSRGAGATDQGWSQLPDGTWSRQSSYSSQTSVSGGSASGSTEGGSVSSRGGSNLGVETGGQSSSRATSTSLGGSSDSLGVLMNAARGPGDYHGTMRKSELEKEAGGAVFSQTAGSETRNQVANTQYRGGGGAGQAYGNEYRGASEVQESRNQGASTQYRKSSAGSLYNELESEDADEEAKYSGEGEDYVTTARGRWVWSEQTKGWVWEEGGADARQQTGGGAQSGRGAKSSSDAGSSDSGWTILPNGTYVRKVSSWSAQSSNSRGAGGSVGGANSESSGGGRGASGRGYFESGTIGGYNSGTNQEVDSGSSDSGWVLLANGTYVRKRNSWSASSDSSVKAGVGAGAMIPGGEFGDEGSNSTGWIRQPDGTMVKKSSSWASWSSASAGDIEDERLQTIQRQLQDRAKNKINSVPTNVEPGFENQYIRTHRRRRSLEEFHNELGGCDPRKCTIIRCTIGPLEKEEGVIFKVRSRLFTETMVKNYAEKVQISSKLLTRVTKLPFFVQEEMLAFQSQTVTTTVIPSELGEALTPWWVWLLAALAGLLLLGLITYGLYKCGFFKRKRPDDSPESEPLNGRNGY